MIAQDVIGHAHQSRQLVAEHLLGQEGCDVAAQNVVRLGKLHRALRLMRRIDHAGVAEGGRDMDRKADRRSQRGKARVVNQILHERDRFLALDAAAVMGEDFRRIKRFALNGAQVHAEARFAGFKENTYAGGLQRTAAGIAGAGIVAEDRKNRRVAARRNACGHRLAKAKPAAGKPVDGGAVNRGQRRLAAKAVYRLIGNAVADDEHVFHKRSSF